MALISQGSIFAFGGGTLVHARGTAIRVIRAGAELAHFDTDAPVVWIKVSPDGLSALLYGPGEDRIWQWSERSGLRLLATAADSRDRIGAGFLAVDATILTLLAKGGWLSGRAQGGHERFAANIRSPHALCARDFVPLPGRRVALVGSFFSDYADVVVTVNLDTLVHDAEAVQQAIRSRAPVWDRAVALAVGPCEPGSAVVLRDPEGTEVPEDENDVEDLGDVFNFTGVYVRDLDTGRLVERQPYSGGPGSGAPMAATAEWIAVQVKDGIDMIRRGTGAIRKVDSAILDVAGFQAALIQDAEVRQVVPLSELLQPG